LLTQIQIKSQLKTVKGERVGEQNLNTQSVDLDLALKPKKKQNGEHSHSD